MTLFVLAIGLLGLAFLQAQGMQFNTSAYARSQASILAGDLIDRIRLNPGGAAAYDTASFTPDPGSCDETLAPTPDNDRDCWYRDLQDLLPAGTGDITVDGGGVVTVTISWRERPGGRFADDVDVADLDSEDLDEFRVQQVSMSVTI